MSTPTPPVLGYMLASPPARRRRWRAWLAVHTVASYVAVGACTVWWFCTSAPIARDEAPGCVFTIVVAAPVVLPLYALVWLFVSVAQARPPAVELVAMIGVYALAFGIMVLVRRLLLGSSCRG